MQKNYSRAYNRHKQHVKFVRRVKNWFSSWSGKYKKQYVDEALSGKNFTFLRTTGRPCNCEGCTYRKYKRTPKHKVIRDAFNE